MEKRTLAEVWDMYLVFQKDPQLIAAKVRILLFSFWICLNLIKFILEQNYVVVLPKVL